MTARLKWAPVQHYHARHEFRGVFLKQGRSARIEGNKFVGGGIGRSAVTVLNDPTLCFSHASPRFQNVE